MSWLPELVMAVADTGAGTRLAFTVMGVPGTFEPTSRAWRDIGRLKLTVELRPSASVAVALNSR